MLSGSAAKNWVSGWNRHELDQIYRHFLTLADTTKTVEDSHILELIRKIHDERSRPSVTESPRASIISAGKAAAAAASAALGAHENEQQEDYLWGV